jgi:uroporphyrinogen-III synthase
MASKIKKILVSQPKPDNDKSPYLELAERNNLKIDFRPFIKVEGIPAKEFRQERIDILNIPELFLPAGQQLIIFSGLQKRCVLSVPDSMKYFCISESVALYLQKYIVYRKRKIFYGNNVLKTWLNR